MFTIKEVANSLQMSTQAIYKQKDELIAKGYMEKNEQGNWEITDNGFNYLQDKKIKYMQQHTNQPIQPVVNQPQKEDATEEVEEEKKKQPSIDISNNMEVVNLVINQYKEQLQTVTNQLQEMKAERDYFKAKFEEKDNLCNQYINSHLLPPIEQEPTENNTKKNIWQRLFNK